LGWRIENHARFIAAIREIDWLNLNKRHWRAAFCRSELLKLATISDGVA